MHCNEHIKEKQWSDVKRTKHTVNLFEAPEKKGFSNKEGVSDLTLPSKLPEHFYETLDNHSVM